MPLRRGAVNPDVAEQVLRELVDEYLSTHDMHHRPYDRVELVEEFVRWVEMMPWRKL